MVIQKIKENKVYKAILRDRFENITPLMSNAMKAILNAVVKYNMREDRGKKFYLFADHDTSPSGNEMFRYFEVKSEPSERPKRIGYSSNTLILEFSYSDLEENILTPKYTACSETSASIFYDDPLAYMFNCCGFRNRLERKFTELRLHKHDMRDPSGVVMLIERE